MQKRFFQEVGIFLQFIEIQTIESLLDLYIETHGLQIGWRSENVSFVKFCKEIFFPLLKHSSLFMQKHYTYIYSETKAIVYRLQID